MLRCHEEGAETECVNESKRDLGAKLTQTRSSSDVSSATTRGHPTEKQWAASLLK